MAESKTLELGSGEAWRFTDETYSDGGGHIDVSDVVGRVMVNLEDVDAFCEALKAFRDEVTKPKMTGGERVFAVRKEVRGVTYSWSDCSPDVKAYYQREAELLGIKDDE